MGIGGRRFHNGRVVNQNREHMNLKFCRLNENWNAEPNAPNPTVAIDGEDVLLSFFLNSFLYTDFQEEDRGLLRFIQCERYRLGPANDEGW